MNISKFTRLKNGQYKLLLENGNSIIIHEDLILKYKLLITKYIELSDIDKLITENINYIAYDLALKYISNKMRSIFETKQYLLKKEVDNNTIEEVINKLIKQGYLNDDIYCKAYITDRINLSNDGPYKIIKSLNNNFINEEYIEKNITLFTKNIELDRINKLIDKQIKSNHNKGSFVLKQKIINYLTELGYTKSSVIERVNNINIDDSNLYKKEYDKLYKILSKKYKDNELEFKIKQKLYQKGFKSSE